MSGCSDKESGAAMRKTPPTVPVTMASVTQKTVPMRIHAIGNVTPYTTVSIKARVDGQITKVYFKEGADVKKGQILFQLDPRPFQAQLKQAEATLARDQAQMRFAQAQAQRYEKLVEQHFVSKDNYAQYANNLNVAKANVAADEALVANARLNLEYTTIRSPIDGRTGKILIQEGNLVKANDTNPLVVINQIQPIYVSFSVPEQDLESIHKYLSEGSLQVEAQLPGADASTLSGKLVFVDNAVDQATGTITLRAAFANKRKLLWPGLFTKVDVTLYQQKNAIVVPSEAVQTGPKGEYVYVVKPDMSAEMRPITVERSDDGLAVIAKGLKPGERVVTTGQIRLSPGAKVSESAAQQSS
jgi:multidrug efflux system membrane fusion protein